LKAYQWSRLVPDSKMDSRVEALRFLSVRLPIGSLARLGLVRAGLLTTAEVRVSRGLTVDISKSSFSRIYDLLHVIDDGWAVEIQPRGIVRLQSKQGAATMECSEFFSSPWRGVLKGCGWEFEAGYVRKDGLTFHESDDLYVLHETFDHEAYKPLSRIAGRIVVDVGASFGDTAVYFSKLGAKVIAIEAVPSVLNRARRNILLNGCEDGVVLVNAVVAGHAEPPLAVVNNRPSSRSGGYSVLRRSSGARDAQDASQAVPVRTLSDILGPLDAELLKLDCEGSEFGIILHDYESILRFRELIVEWHESISKRPVATLVRRLSKDFDVRVSYGLTGAEESSGWRSISKSDVGMIHATRSLPGVHYKLSAGEPARASQLSGAVP
jgi:FkbM family methyltransferase